MSTPHLIVRRDRGGFRACVRRERELRQQGIKIVSGRCLDGDGGGDTTEGAGKVFRDPGGTET